MKLINRIIDTVFYLGMIPILCVGLYALWDAFAVSQSANIDEGLIELANRDDDELFKKTDTDSKYIIAWLSIKGTNINYPVVQGEDNAYFLNRNYKGEYATAGSLFLDYRNSKDFSDVFSIIYGHRMGNGEMFSDIHRFKDGDFLAAHKTGQLKLRGSDYDFEILSYAEVKSDNWGIYNVEKSRNNSDVIRAIVGENDNYNLGIGRYILLSTCDGVKKKLRNVLLVKLLV